MNIYSSMIQIKLAFFNCPHAIHFFSIIESVDERFLRQKVKQPAKKKKKTIAILQQTKRNCILQQAKS